VTPSWLDGHTPSEEGSGTSSFPRASGARAWFVLVLLVLPGSQLLVYPVLWILMPNEETDSTAEVTTPIATTI
jgi:hypothetical protein